MPACAERARSAEPTAERRPEDPVLLTGLPGSGKSCVGRLLAARLGFAFLDTDLCIEERAGMSIPELFAREGEPRFRALERDVIATLPVARTVIALGGGALQSEENRRALGPRRTLVWLEAAPETALARMGEAEDRPLLRGVDPRGRLARLAELLAARRAGYATARLRVATDRRSPEDVCEAVLAALRRAEGRS
jgi:shikimate kinase